MSAVEKFFRDLMKDLLVEAVEHAVTRLRTPTQSLVSTPAANDDNNENDAAAATSADKAESIAHTATVDYAAIKEDCLAIINALAPTHGPQIRALFAEFAIKRLSEAGDQLLPAIFERLEALKNAE